MSAPSKAAGSPVAPPLLDSKAWAGLCAKAALAGYALARTDFADGPVRLLVCRNGVWHELRTVDDIEDLVVACAGGRP